ncbi:hypothetical protein A0H81_13904 [Grifola frondosa]|uniref:Uncharacterized protein n=1 Tax=Grifola frondosa TaxID=5627 RepID=A0A1C7LNI5_GRIFR|nr:hypothetical protein A0H81_13904 [Grifola frondosa]
MTVCVVKLILALHRQQITRHRRRRRSRAARLESSPAVTHPIQLLSKFMSAQPIVSLHRTGSRRALWPRHNGTSSRRI